MNYEAYDQLLTPIIVVNPKGEIQYFNHICTVFFKKSPRILGQLKGINDLIPSKELDYKKLLKSVSKENTSQTSPEINIEDEMTLILKFIPVEKNILINVLDFSIEKKLHDKYKEQVSELRENHEQIVKADKLTALGEMIAGISHEVSTPLTIVSDRLEKLSNSLALRDVKESEGILSEVSTSFHRVLKIITGMQSFARNHEDRFIITDIADLVDDSLNFFNDLNHSGSIQIDKKIESSHWVMANPLKLQQVLINLVKNSSDAIMDSKTKNGKITIEIIEDSESQTHCIKVKDNGPGISKENQEKIFDMFYTSKEISEGTGLGLSISKKIIESHNGEIVLSDTKEGCEFLINLPIIEIGSFTRTNKYLRGEADYEDEKILFIGSDINLLNDVYEVMEEKDYVIIFSNKIETVTKVADFLMIDQVVLFDDLNCEFEYTNQHKLIGMSRDNIISKIEELF